MSNKLWTPSQKGTDLLPLTGQPPIRLRVTGVPIGSPQEAQLVAAYQGILSQFIAKQRHAYSLSTIPIQQGRITRDGVVMTYQNQHGLEYATLEVRPTSSSTSGGKTKKRRRWDWALIEIMLPYTLKAQLMAFASMRVPYLGAPTPDDDLPFPGIAHSPASDAPVDRLINSPLLDVDLDRVSLTTDHTSFLVDLRPLHGMPAAQVDIHAWVQVMPEVLPLYQVGWETGPDIGDPPYFDPDTATSLGLNFGGHPTGYTQEEFDALQPEVTFNRVTRRWEFADPTDVYVVADGGYWKTIASPTVPGWHIIWGVYNDPDDYDAGYIGPSPAPSEVQVTMFYGPPMVPGKYRSEFAPYMRWDFTTPDSSRLPYSLVGEPLLPTSTNGDFGSPANLSNFYQIPLTGTVTLPVEVEGDVLPGPSFKDAT